MRLRTYLIAGGAGILALSGTMAFGPMGWLRSHLAPLTQPVAEAFAAKGTTAADDVAGGLREQVAKLGAENAEMRIRLSEYAQIQGEGKVPAERVVIARGRIIGRTRRSGRRYLELDIGNRSALSVQNVRSSGQVSLKFKSASLSSTKSSRKAESVSLICR